MDRVRGHLTKDVSSAVSSLVWMKVVVIGNTGCGKTSIIKYFCERKFSPNYQPTVGVDYGFKIHRVFGKDLRVHLWDLSGSEDYADVRNELYGGPDAVVLVFDVSDSISFQCLPLWLAELNKYGPSNAVPICLIGNKVDLKDKRSISANEARKFATSHRMSYSETSCLLGGDGVDRIITSFLETALKNKNKSTDKAHRT